MTNQERKVTVLTASPMVTQLWEERTSLALDLYRLALKEHSPEGAPCDEDIECQACTLLLIASEELGQPDPFDPSAWPTTGVQQ